MISLFQRKYECSQFLNYLIKTFGTYRYLGISLFVQVFLLSHFFKTLIIISPAIRAIDAISATIRTQQDIQCLTYAGFFLLKLELKNNRAKYINMPDQHLTLQANLDTFWGVFFLLLALL